MNTPREEPASEYLTGAMLVNFLRLAMLFGTFLCGIVAGMAYIFTNFATIRYVDQKYVESVNHADSIRVALETKITSVKEGIDRVEQTLLRIESRTLDAANKK